jgi:hypothetical protein
VLIFWSWHWKEEKEAMMTDTVHSVIDAFLAFRSRQIQRAAWDNSIRQMSALPAHLIIDVDPYAASAAERDLIAHSFKKSDGIHKINSFD